MSTPMRRRNTAGEPPRRRGTYDRHGVAGYTAALVLLVLSYGLCAVQRSQNPSPFAFLLILVTIAVVFHVTAVRAAIQRAAWVVLAVAGVATIVATVIGAEGQMLDIVFSAASVVALLVAPAAIVAHQAKRRGFNLEALLATITAYVLVGLLFAFLFNLVSLVTPTPIFGEENAESLSNQLFFSFTTLTTTGYGNLVPSTPGSEAVAVTEAITGQLFLITAVARIMRGASPRSVAETGVAEETT
ncbi:ion channel [Microbacterium sp. SA39]|uniref:ion channel n=1 Tax=Microbacterium sp. SA39 TaxID=1263625 RepID=UPI000696AD71|nr:ion channel [Microbacterium sp. SA39]